MTMSVATAARTLWDYHCIHDDVVTVDVVVGLGSYDIRVATRSAELYHADVCGRVVFTGASGNWTRGKSACSEARTFADHAGALGVPEDAMAVEEQATNIGENIQFTARLAGVDDRRCMFVTKPHTQRRCKATVDVHLPDARHLVTAPAHGFAEQPTADHSFDDLVDEMVGDLFRIAYYPSLGFQSPQPLPDNVCDAFERLVAAGHSGHLPSEYSPRFWALLRARG